MAPGRKHARDLREQLAWVLHVLQHLLAVDELEAAVVEGEAAAVEGHELGVRAGAARDLGRVLDVDPHPAHVRIDRAEQVDRVARAAAEVHHATGSQAACVLVREHGPAVVGRDARAEQVA